MCATEFLFKTYKKLSYDVNTLTIKLYKICYQKRYRCIKFLLKKNVSKINHKICKLDVTIRSTFYKSRPIVLRRRVYVEKSALRAKCKYLKNGEA